MVNRNNLKINVSIALNSFNYIACVWEPSIERTKINFEYLKNDKINFFFENNDLLINLSDMNISFILSSLNNWINKFIEELKYYEDNISDIYNFQQIKNEESKISNNEVYNYTGEKLKIKYAGQIILLESQKRY